MVLASDESTGDETIADVYVFPATHIMLPKGSITSSITGLGTKPAPFMAAFSSQGPSTINPKILKPDITAPGVSVITAYTEGSSPTSREFDKRRIPFNSESVRSMSCPHIAGVVGLLRAAHPDWSPSAIKSAIMTTVRVRDNKGQPINNSSLAKANPFNYASGHVRPNPAVDPGLVYDLNITDYLKFLCAIGYNSSQISTFKRYNCPSKTPFLMDLNFPSITIPSLGDSITVTRMVKNVGVPGTFEASVRNPRGIKVLVKPACLTFERIGEKKTFEITLAPKGRNVTKDYVFGTLQWSDGRHDVRSPITVKSRGVKNIRFGEFNLLLLPLRW